MEINFITNPPRSFWVLFPIIVCCEDPIEYPEFYHYSIPRDTLNNDEILEIVQNIMYIDTDLPVAFSMTENDLVVVACLMSRLRSIEAHRGLLHLKTSYASYDAAPLRISQYSIDRILEYRRPLTVVVTGDRGSAVIFDEWLRHEFRSLPKYSIIVHGGCRGVDTYAGKVAKEMGIHVKVYEANWTEYFTAAGPLRNKEILDSEPVDIVFAFHPDITLSKGTAHMMSIAYARGIKVVLFDTKRKTEFRGVFEGL